MKLSYKTYYYWNPLINLVLGPIFMKEDNHENYENNKFIRK